MRLRKAKGSLEVYFWTLVPRRWQLPVNLYGKLIPLSHI